MPWEFGWRSKNEFVSDGIMLAIPLCFPGQSAPPPPGETAATCIALDPAGSLYLGTEGTKAHVIAVVLHGESGAAHDLGAIPNATRVTGLLCNEEGVYLLAEGDGPAKLMSNIRFSRDFLIQEWGFARRPYETLLDLPVDHVLDAVVVDENTFIALGGGGEIIRVNVAEPAAEILATLEAPFSPKLGRLNDQIFIAAGGAISEVTENGLEKIGAIDGSVTAWTGDDHDGVLYFSVDGRLLSLTGGDVVEIGKPTRWDIITCMTVGNDGRVFGMAGGEEDLAHLFVYSPKSGEMSDRGVPVSTLTTRQYGYLFACATTGEGGEIYFGQHERTNFLWMYLPEILKR